MYKNTSFKKFLSFLLCLAIILSYLPAGVLKTSAAEQTLDIVEDSKKADPGTLDNWRNYFGPGKMDTEFAGLVWTDKSVFTDETADLPGVTLDGDNNFLVALSAIASNLTITGYASAPTDTMLVLDLSGSMVNRTYDVGTIRQNNGYQAVKGIDMSLIEAMIEATNATIDKLMKQNSNNRVGVVLYSGNAATNQAATTGTATLVLPLDRYTGIDGKYLSVDTTWRTETLYNASGWPTGQTATYVAENTAVYVSVENGLKTESGGNVTDSSKQANGGTYTQNGLYQAMNEFLKVTDTTVPAGRPQAGEERKPVIVLMTDGAPTIATTNYTEIGTSGVGDGRSDQDASVLNRITFLTQLTAAYVRGRVAAKYQESASDEKDVLFLTLGLGTENSTGATSTLYPAGSNSTLVKYWGNYFNARVDSNATIISGDDGLTVRRDAAVEAMNYVDKYFYASDAQGLIDSFQEILSEITIRAESYTTLVEGSGADFSGYVTFEDELGEMMYVADMKGVIMSDGNGGKLLYSGRNIAQGISNGSLGTVDNPTELGQEMINSVKERIPGLTTTQAQQLVANAYNDRQLYYADDNNWSNYIGWYADADGNYVGFWDKDSGYENAPANAVYANRSYGYLGVNGDSNMMHVVVMVRTELATLHQTVNFKIPASLLPTVQYDITLDDDDPSKVSEFIREGAEPMRLIFEVGLRPDINSVNLEEKLAEHAGHLDKGGYVLNEDGSVTFFTNAWAIGEDKNGNGIPDPDEMETAIVTQSHFHPALENTRFYYTEDTVILTGNGSTVTGSTRPTDTDNNSNNGTGYYYDRYIYAPDGRTVIHTPIDATTLANDAQYDSANNRWYIPAGTVYRNLARFEVVKRSNLTDTLDYSFFPAVFDSIGKQDVYTYLGNNGSITVAPATGITLTKQVEGTIENVDSYTFEVTLSNIPSGATAAPVLTDANGDALPGVTMSAYTDGKFTVKMPANVTAYISGIPVGTTVQIAELIDGDYKVIGITVAGQTQSGTEATATIPAYSPDGDQMVPVVFTNSPNAYGSLVISKDVNYPQGFVPGDAHNNKIFTIRVTFTGDITAMVAPEGAIRDGNTFTLELKDGESATFSNIKEGVTYTVTEGSVPTGYEFQDLRYSDANHKIDGQDLDEVHVVNRYTLQPVKPNVKIQGDKTLITNESSWGGETFTVELLRIDNFADQDPVSTGLTATMTEANPHYEFDLSSIEFTEAGTYYFRAVEVIPDNRNENIAYDRTFGLFSITVGDADADGSLEIQSVAAYQDSTVTGNATDGWILEKDFTNVVTTDRIYLDIQKHVVDANTGDPVNKHLGDITFGLFTSMDNGLTPSYFALTNINGEATIMIPVTKEFITDAGGELIYYMREIAPAVANRVVGMNYDESWMYAIRITWDDEENQAVVEYAPIEDDQTGTYTVYTNGSFIFEQTNTYESNVSVDIDLTGNKTLNGGNDLGGREFSFSLYKSTAAFVQGELIKTVTNNGNAISFSDISFTEPGVYYMVAKENASTLGGITIDPTVYHITVEVEKFTDTDGTTRLRVVQGYPTVVVYGTSENVGTDGLDFDNTYTVTGSGDVTIGGLKVLNGRAMVAGEFTIGLYEDEACTKLIESVTNRADGTFSFSTITYTAEDLGENNAKKTYTYYVKEIPGTKGGVTYDPNVYTVTVTVSHSDGKLVVTPSGNATTLQITNTYAAKPVDVVLNGSKVLSGDWSSVENENKNFTIQLFQADSKFVITDQTPVQTANVTGASAFKMTLNYKDGQEDYYYYVLKEVIPAERAGGVAYDAGEYHITINVTDPGNGQLVAFTTIYRPGSGNQETAVFTNIYSVEPITITLEGTKTYTNSVTGETMDMEEGMFSFLVLEGEDLVATGYNLADGTIRFTPISYTAAGVHIYSIVELPGDAGGVSYDDTVFTVTVTVVDNGDGTLTATADYNNTPVAFENTYTHAAAQVTFNGEKILTGDWSAVPEASKLFSFELYETASDFVVSGDPVDFTTGAQGEFTFGAQTYTTAGIHYYVILERSGETGKGITYDGTEYHITVVVEDDGNGNLIPTVTGNATITADAENSRLVTVDGLNFTNRYETKPAQYTPVAQKIYERKDGEEMKAFDFILTVNGSDKQTKQNDSEGKVVFDTLTFETAGVYTLTIREQRNILWGLIRWDVNVYTITLHVEDNGEGQLFVNESKTVITSEKGTDDLVFHNADYDVITEKDVFTVTEPTVSIDGKAVELNDILLYKISYTNFDSVPVDIEIIDTIPQYTVYVDGSADNGGTLSGNTLHWKLEDVAPNATVTVSFQVTVVDTNVTIVNDATVLEGENEYHTNEVTNPVKEDKIIKDVFLPTAPTVSIDGKAVEKNDILLYKVTYTNSDDFAADVTITDAIPQYTTYVDGSADNGGIYKDGVITWSLHLAAGESKTVSFQVKVVDTNITVINQATALEGENKLESNKVTNPVKEDKIIKDVFTVTEPSVSIDGKAVEKGDILLYKVTYTNSDDFAADVTITDAIPQYTTYVDGSADNGGIYKDGVITWSLHLAAGESKTVSFQVKVVDTKITVINQATALEGENELVSNQVKNPVDEDLITKDVFTVSAPTVSIDGKTVEKGDILLYKVTYTNSDGLAADVTITDAIPQYTTYVDGSADNGGIYKDGVITWSLHLEAGESKTVSFQVKVVDTNITVVNQATALEGENKLESNKVTNPVKEDKIIKDVFLPAAPTVSIDGETVEKNDILLYKVTYTNSDDFAADVTITDAIPQYTTYVDGSADNGGIYKDGVITWSLHLEAGESKTVSFQVKVVDTNITVINQATAQEGENKLESNQVTNPVKEDKVIKDVFTVTEPSVSIDGKTVEKGDILLYKVTYTNSDDFAADVTITDAIPQYTTYVDGSADNGGIYKDGVITWSLHLAAGESKTVSFQVKVVDTNITVINQATAQEGENKLDTNQVTNPVKEDKVIKDVFLPAAPTISIDGETVEKGDILLYKVTYTNSDDFAADVTITDTIPQYTTYVDGSADNGGIYKDGVITWSLHLEAGESKTVSFQVKVVDTKITVINQATALEGENRLDTNIVRNPVEEDLITKDVFTVTEPSVSIDGKAVEKGDILLYKVTYTNSDGLAADVTITDTIPQYTTYVDGSADNGGTYKDGVITWSLHLAAGESKTVSFQVKVVGTNITVVNQATALEGENKLESNKVTNPVKEDKVIKDVFTVTEPSVSIDGKTVEKGDILLYKVTYTNSDDFAADVTITDAIPQYTTYVDGSADNGGIYKDGVITWSLKLAAGESKTVSFQVKVVDTNITVINQATAQEGENKLDTNQVKNPVKEDEITKDVSLPTVPTVSIDGKTVEKNDILLYKVTYTNSDDFAADVTITDTIPQYTTYVDGSADNGGIYKDGVITWSLHLAAGESKTVSFQVKVVDTNITVINQATALEGENKLESNKVTNPVKEDKIIKDVFLPAAPTVSIDGETVEKNDILLYKVTYTNSDDFAADVTITDAIPQYTTYVDGSADNGGIYKDGVITWSLKLAAGESKTVSFQVKVVDTNITVVNQATALEGENKLESNQVTNPVEEDEITKDVFTVSEPSVSIDGKIVEKGDILLYKVTYTNSDDFAADVTITDAIPQHTTYVDGSADNGGIYEDGVITWSLHLAAGESKTVSFQVKVTGGEGQTVVNQATALEGENKLESNQVTNPVEEDTIIKDVFLPAAPTISIDGKAVEKGDILLYKVTYTNSDDFAADVTITDAIPQYTTYVDGSADNGGIYKDGVIAWSLHLAAGESKTVSFQVKVVDTNITVINQATALEGENRLDTNIVRNPVEEDLITKDVFTVSDPTVSIDGKTVEKGDVLLYTITYTNSDGQAADVTITDAIPQYTIYVDGSADNGGIYTDGVITWSMHLEAGESKTVSFQVKVTGGEGQTVVNQATGLEGENKLESNQVTNPVEEDEITKDVFLPAAPTVSIDGETVEKNDILLYKVTYTNSDDFAADVTITDAIPQYTTYVDGSADNGGIYKDGMITWSLHLAAGESKTVSFQVKVVDTNITVINQATALEGENKLESNQVTNPVEEDKLTKDVFLPAAPTVSIDGKAVEMGDILLYKVTYTNSDDFAADVTITDAIPQHTTYVDGSADNGGIYEDGVITWSLHLEAGESMTVSFQVKVMDINITVTNQATALEGENELESNQVINSVPDNPQTGDDMNVGLLASLMLSSVACLFVLVISRKRFVG